MKVLDLGYVELVESWGSDERIIEAARMSTQKGFKGWGTPEAPGDEKLLRRLWKRRHFTPFEMAGLIVEVKAPIFVFREWQRHRTQSYNEMSARYSPLPDENYIPTIERIMMDGGSNKQACGTGKKIDRIGARRFIAALNTSYAEQQNEYISALDDGVPKELARLLLPVGRYSKMRASANLRNWTSFLSLRLDKDAQWEIRQYAEAVLTIVKEAFPRTAVLFEEGFNASQK